MDNATALRRLLQGKPVSDAEVAAIQGIHGEGNLDSRNARREFLALLLRPRHKCSHENPRLLLPFFSARAFGVARAQSVLRVGPLSPMSPMHRRLLPRISARRAREWFEERLGQETKIEWFIYNAGAFGHGKRSLPARSISRMSVRVPLVNALRARQAARREDCRWRNAWRRSARRGGVTPSRMPRIFRGKGHRPPPQTWQHPGCRVPGPG